MSKTKYPKLCDLSNCGCGKTFNSRTDFSYHKRKLDSIKTEEMSKPVTTAVTTLDIHVESFLTILGENNFDGNSIKQLVDVFFKSKAVIAEKPQIVIEVEKRFANHKKISKEKDDELGKIIDDEKLRSTDQTTLEVLVQSLRERKEDDGSSSVSGNNFLKEFKHSNDWIEEEMAFLKGKLAVLEFEKFRRANYGNEIVYNCLKRKFDGVDSAKKNRFAPASQEVCEDFDSLN